FVWYSPAAFDRAHYALPTTWDELVALTEEVVADHPDGSVTPWCLGVADGDTTGWPMTDWLEETILATGGTGAYDAWADHNVSLDDPSAVRALDTVGSLLLGKGRVPGGREGALSTTMEQAGQELVDGSCLMMMASSSFESMLPAGTVVTDAEGRGATATASAAGDGVSGGRAVEAAGSDGATADGATGVSAFVLPSAEKEDGDAPVLVGGDYLVSLRGRTGTSAAASAVLDYLTSAGWAQERAELGGMATANRGVEVDEVSSDVAARATRILQSRQSVVRLDASDSMPSQVGTDALWNALSSWTAGEVGSRRALARAEAAWPADR
ncbi:MAG: carbohydrate ABC transporter substrate-binding protein, partial [Actinomyces sp.]